MVADDFRVEVIGHATLRVQRAGRTLLTDPWLIDPIGCNSGFHFPPLVHDPATLAAETDAIYLSHVHPDHFSPASLRLFAKTTPIYLGAYRRKEFRDRVRALGFPVIEVPFQQPVALAETGFEITLLEHDAVDSAAYDSAIVIRTPDFSLFENNDCPLRPEKYRWVRERFTVDYAFLGYSPASFFPICFELEPDEKARLLREAADRRYDEFIDAAALLGARLAVPFASDLRFLAPSLQWKNVLFNSASEAVRRLRARGLAGEVMGPGDRLASDGTLRRFGRVLAPSEEDNALAEYARRRASWIDALGRPVQPAEPDVVVRFREYMLRLWGATRDRLPDVRRHVIAYHVRGAARPRFYFDFSRPEEEIFQWGDPPRYDMRYTYDATALQQRLDGDVDWDELHFTSDVSIHQICFARDFYRMLRSDVLDLG